MLTGNRLSRYRLYITAGLQEYTSLLNLRIGNRFSVLADLDHKPKRTSNWAAEFLQTSNAAVRSRREQKKANKANRPKPKKGSRQPSRNETLGHGTVAGELCKQMAALRQEERPSKISRPSISAETKAAGVTSPPSDLMRNIWMPQLRPNSLADAKSPPLESSAPMHPADMPFRIGTYSRGPGPNCIPESALSPSSASAKLGDRGKTLPTAAQIAAASAAQKALTGARTVLPFPPRPIAFGSMDVTLPSHCPAGRDELGQTQLRTAVPSVALPSQAPRPLSASRFYHFFNQPPNTASDTPLPQAPAGQQITSQRATNEKIDFYSLAHGIDCWCSWAAKRRGELENACKSKGHQADGRDSSVVPASTSNGSQTVDSSTTQQDLSLPTASLLAFLHTGQSPQSARLDASSRTAPEESSFAATLEQKSGSSHRSFTSVALGNSSDSDWSNLERVPSHQHSTRDNQSDAGWTNLDAISNASHCRSPPMDDDTDYDFIDIAASSSVTSSPATQSSSTSTGPVLAPQDNTGHSGNTSHRVRMSYQPWQGAMTPYPFDPRALIYGPASPLITVPTADPAADAFWTPTIPGRVSNGWNVEQIERADFQPRGSLTHQQADTGPAAPAAVDTFTTQELFPSRPAERSFPASDTDIENDSSTEWPSLAAAAMTETRNKRSGSGSSNGNARLQNSHGRPV